MGLAGGTGESERDMPSEGSAAGVRVVDGAMGLSSVCMYVGMVRCGPLCVRMRVSCVMMSWPTFLVWNTQHNT